MTSRDEILLPGDVLPATDAQRRDRADRLTKELRRLALDDGHKAIVAGQLLHDVRRQELWRDFAESWKEYVNDIGLSLGGEFMRRKNYETFVLELGLDPTDPRLSEAPASKLAVGTRTKFKQWVADNIDDFLDFARLPLGEGGLTRADLNKYIEEEVGISDRDEDSMTRRSLRAFRKGAFFYNQLSDDSWLTFIQAVRDDDDLYAALATIVEQGSKREPSRTPVDTIVELEDE